MSSLTKKAFAVHSAVGVLTGLFLYAVVFTGTVALFQEEVVSWSNPQLRFSTPQSKSVDALLSGQASALPDRADPLLVFLPTIYQPSLRVVVPSHDDPFSLEINPRTGERLPARAPGFETVWRRAHTDGLLGRPGRYIIGVAGLVMLLALTTGLLAHRKMFRQLITWRRDRSFRVSVGDLHKLLGLWGSIAHLLFAFTGAILGLLSLLSLVSAFVVYEGDTKRAVAAVLGPPIQPSGRPAPPPELDPLFARAVAIDPEVDWNLAAVLAWGDENAHVEVAGLPRNALSMRRVARFRAEDDALVREVDWVRGGPWHRLFGMVQPLHYADFGGPLVKVLYVVLGLSGALLIATGLVVWLDGRQRGSHGSDRSRLAGLTAGVLGAFPVATFALPIIDRTMVCTSPNRLDLLIGAYAALVLAACLYAQIRPPRRALWELLMATAACSGLSFVLDVLLVGTQGAFMAHAPATMTNFALLAVALSAASTAWWLPQRAFDRSTPGASRTQP